MTQTCTETQKCVNSSPDYWSPIRSLWPTQVWGEIIAEGVGTIIISRVGSERGCNVTTDIIARKCSRRYEIRYHATFSVPPPHFTQHRLCSALHSITCFYTTNYAAAWAKENHESPQLLEARQSQFYEWHPFSLYRQLQINNTTIKHNCILLQYNLFSQ